MALLNDRFINDIQRRGSLDLDRMNVGQNSLLVEASNSLLGGRTQASRIWGSYVYLPGRPPGTVTETDQRAGSAILEWPWYTDLRIAFGPHTFFRVEPTDGLHLIEPDQFDAEGNWITEHRQRMVDRLEEIFGRQILTMDDTTSLAI